jgi:serine/threonine protein kinase
LPFRLNYNGSLSTFPEPRPLTQDAAMTIADLVAALGQYRLLEPAQQKELEQSLQPRFTEPKALARELVQRGWLTPYQGNQLLQGHGSKLLLGSYVLLERLGEGGMGTVFKARNWKLGQVVAIKLIRKQRLDSTAAVTRFQREIRACARLNHPNIVRAFDADEVAGIHLLVMELVDGTDLGKLVKESGPLPVAQACEYIRQAALGLQHAHEHGLIHRDIKPSNLLLTRRASSLACPPATGASKAACPTDHMVKILDLGLARMTHTASEDSPSTLTESGAVMGTPDYLAPEQARQSHEVDIRADLYSLGCTLYFLLTGKAPFAGGNLGEKLVKHQLDEPVPVEQLRPEVPPEVAVIVRRLMAKKPQERYQTPAELEQALRAGQRPMAISAIPPRIPTADDSTMGFASITEPPSTAEAVDSPRRLRQAASQRRWRWLDLAGGGVLLGMLGVFLLLVQRSGTAKPEPSPGAEVEVVKDGKVIAWVPPMAKPPGVEQQWIDAVATLPAEKQVEVVAAKLKERNPGFDGQVTPKIEQGAVTGLALSADHVTDIGPVRALTRLRTLQCSGSGVGKGQLADLSPLKDMPLTSLQCHYTRVADLGPLQGMPLTTLHCNCRRVEDLSPLQGMPLTSLQCHYTRVADLSPLQGMSLQDIRFTPTKITKGLDILRGMQSLKTIGVSWEKDQAWPAAEFWKRYDAGEFQK